MNVFVCSPDLLSQGYITRNTPFLVLIGPQHCGFRREPDYSQRAPVTSRRHADELKRHDVGTHIMSLLALRLRFLLPSRLCVGPVNVVVLAELAEPANTSSEGRIDLDPEKQMGPCGAVAPSRPLRFFGADTAPLSPPEKLHNSNLGKQIPDGNRNCAGAPFTLGFAFALSASFHNVRLA